MLDGTQGVAMSRFAVAVSVSLALLVAGAAGAQTEKWNQQKVTALSGELMNSVQGLQTDLENSSQAMDPMMEDTVAQISDALGILEFEAIHLNAMLKSGKGLKKTLPAYKRLQEIHSELMGYQGQIAITAFLSPPLTKAKTALAKLAAYYPPQPQ
jgi:hypothetical protein